MGNDGDALELFAFQRRALDFVLPLREALEELFGIELVEGGLSALEEELGQPLASQPTSEPDLEILALVRGLDRQLLPGLAIDQGVNAEISIRVVELEEDVRFIEGDLVIVGPTRWGSGQQ